MNKTRHNDEEIDDANFYCRCSLKIPFSRIIGNSHFAKCSLPMLISIRFQFNVPFKSINQKANIQKQQNAQAQHELFNIEQSKNPEQCEWHKNRSKDDLNEIVHLNRHQVMARRAYVARNLAFDSVQAAGYCSTFITVIRSVFALNAWHVIKKSTNQIYKSPYFTDLTFALS